MKFLKEDLLVITDECDVEEKGMFFVEATEWVADYKFQNRQVIFKYDGKYYAIEESRSGSPFSEYHYDSEYWSNEVECDEVEKVEIVTYEWR